jgi:hypothetical protein
MRKQKRRPEGRREFEKVSRNADGLTKLDAILSALSDNRS